MEEIVFPNQLRMMRRVRGRRMLEIANLLDLSISALSKIEKGYRRLNEDQIRRVAQFLDCPCEALFVSNRSSNPEVIQAWQKEQENRRQMNLGGGLKVLGAGLRYIRGQKKMTLNGVAKGAKLTLSVYHRIEMGQREVDEKTFANIASALGMSDESLQLKIYELDHSGALDELKNSEGKKGVGLFKGGYNDLPMSRLMLRVAESRETTVPVTAVLPENGRVVTLGEPSGGVLCPSTLSNEPGLYAVRVHSSPQNAFLPEGAVLLISPTTPIKMGDWVISDMGLNRVLNIQDDRITVVDFNQKQHMMTREQIQPVVWIALN